MTVRQTVIAGVRTGVQRLVAIGVGAGVAWLARKGIEIDLDLGALQVVVDAVVTGAVTSALVALERRLPWLAPILSLGLAKSGPSYGD